MIRCFLADSCSCRGGDSAGPPGRQAWRPAGACCSTRTTAIRTTAALPIGWTARSRPGSRWPSSRTSPGTAIRGTGLARSIVTHGEPYTGAEPAMREHFFERIRPIVETALRENRTDDWPIITLNLDFKTLEPEHLQAVWALLGEYESWLTTAERPATEGTIAGPRRQARAGADGGSGRAAGRVLRPRARRAGSCGCSGRSPRAVKGAPPIAPVRTNYRRWSNNPWSVVEPEGQPKSGVLDARGRGAPGVGRPRRARRGALDQVLHAERARPGRCLRRLVRLLQLRIAGRRPGEVASRRSRPAWTSWRWISTRSSRRCCAPAYDARFVVLKSSGRSLELVAAH